MLKKSQIIRTSLNQLRTLEQSLSLFIKVNPFAPEATSYLNVYNKLPEHINIFQKLLLSNRISPPLSNCPKQLIIGFLATFQINSVSRQLLGLMVTRLSEQLNDKIRQLNHEELEQIELRKALVDSRNMLDESGVSGKRYQWLGWLW